MTTELIDHPISTREAAAAGLDPSADVGVQFADGEVRLGAVSWSVMTEDELEEQRERDELAKRVRASPAGVAP